MCTTFNEWSSRCNTVQCDKGTVVQRSRQCKSDPTFSLQAALYWGSEGLKWPIKVGELYKDFPKEISQYWLHFSMNYIKCASSSLCRWRSDYIWIPHINACSQHASPSPPGLLMQQSEIACLGRWLCAVQVTWIYLSEATQHGKTEDGISSGENMDNCAQIIMGGW